MAWSAGAGACRLWNTTTVKQRTPAKWADADEEPRIGEEERAGENMSSAGMATGSRMSGGRAKASSRGGGGVAPGRLRARR